MTDRSAGSVVGALARHPLFQLSTAGQELFHTNMLYWLALNRPEQSAAVWDVFDVEVPIVGGRNLPFGRVTREWKHVDLYVDAGTGRRKLVLENKVLAIATAEQLASYHATLLATPLHTRADPGDDLTSWQLLSLLPLTVDAPQPWRHLDYAALVEPLRTTSTALNSSDADLVGQYANLVELLVQLCKEVDIVGDLDQGVLLPAAFTARLKEARLLALVRKLRTARFANLLTQELLASLASAPLRVKVDMSRSEALSELFFPTDGGVEFGWQIQERSVKLAMRTGLPAGSTVATRDKLAVKHRDYFDFASLPLAEELLVKVGKKEWNGYGHDFVYRYRNLRPEVTWSQLLALSHVLTERASTYARDFVSPSNN